MGSLSFSATLVLATFVQLPSSTINEHNLSLISLYEKYFPFDFHQKVFQVVQACALLLSPSQGLSYSSLLWLFEEVDERS